MKALIDLNTRRVTGINRQKGLFEFEVEIFDINPEKTVNTQTVSLLNNPSSFNFDEIVEAKGEKIVSKNMAKFIILNEELDEDDLDLEHPNHSANTGFKFMQLKPNGECTTKLIELPEETNAIKFYLEAELGVIVQFSPDGEQWQDSDGITINNEQTLEKVFLKFINTTNEFKKVFSYGIII